MVSPGEVDEDLEDETASECTKYGKVIKCTICEVRITPRLTYFSTFYANDYTMIIELPS